MDLRVWLGTVLVALATHLAILTGPAAATSQTSATQLPDPSPELRTEQAAEAQTVALPAWQRDYMTQLARGGDPSGALSSVPGRALGPDGSASAATYSPAWAQLVVGARQGQAAVYDSLRNRMLVFGGNAGPCYRNDVWALSLSSATPGPSAWTELLPIGVPPSARGYASAVYDPLRDRMLIFGGNDGSEKNDVWALTLSGTPTWAPVLAAGGSPAGRDNHSSVYDAVNDRLLVFGGNGGGGAGLNDCWALTLAGTPIWSQVTASGTPPAARYGHRAIYDPVRSRMLVFAGYNGPVFGGGTYYNDVWALSLTGAPAWTALTPTGTPPSARANHTVIYDALRDRMVAYGGANTAGLNDTWALSFAGTPAWAGLTPTGSAGYRKLHNAVYDPVHDRMVVSAGSDGFNNLNDSWSLSFAGTPAWTTFAPNTTPPSGRDMASAIYDPVRSRMIVFGGYDTAYRNDVWALSLPSRGFWPTWTMLTPSGTPPSARRAHTAIYDPVRDRMLVFGGSSSGGSLNDLWSLTLSGTATWTMLSPTGGPPAARGGHVAVYDSLQDRMIVFGGGGASLYNDVWALSLSGTPAWTALTPLGSPPSARSAHSAVYDPSLDRMIVFGGYDVTWRNDCWSLSLSGTPTWTTLLPTGTLPSARSNHTAILDPARNQMVVLGGWNGTVLNDVQSLSLSGTPAWTNPAPLFPPCGISSHTAIYDPVHDGMIAFGGDNGTVGQSLNDVPALWLLGSPVSVEGQPIPPTAGFLRAPAPNPFVGSARISWSTSRAGRVTLTVCDVSGRLVRRLVDAVRQAGTETTAWDGADQWGSKARAGVYFVRLESPGFHMTRVLVLLR